MGLEIGYAAGRRAVKGGDFRKRKGFQGAEGAAVGREARGRARGWGWWPEGSARAGGVFPAEGMKPLEGGSAFPPGGLRKEARRPGAGLGTVVRRKRGVVSRRRGRTPRGTRAVVRRRGRTRRGGEDGRVFCRKE